MKRSAATLVGITVISSPLSVLAQIPADPNLADLHLPMASLPNELDWGIQLIIGVISLGVLIVGLTVFKIIWDHFRYKRFTRAVDALSGNDLGMDASEIEALKVQMYIADQNGDGLSFKQRLENATQYVEELRALRDDFAAADQEMRDQLQTRLHSGSDLFDWEKQALKKYEKEAAFDEPIEQAIDRMRVLKADKQAAKKYLTAKTEVYRLLREKLQGEKYVLSNEQRNILAQIEAERAKGFEAAINGKSTDQIDRELDLYLKDDNARFKSHNDENRRRFMTKPKHPSRKNRISAKQRSGWFG